MPPRKKDKGKAKDVVEIDEPDYITYNGARNCTRCEPGDASCPDSSVAVPQRRFSSSSSFVSACERSHRSRFSLEVA